MLFVYYVRIVLKAVIHNPCTNNLGTTTDATADGTPPASGATCRAQLHLETGASLGRLHYQKTTKANKICPQAEHEHSLKKTGEYKRRCTFGSNIAFRVNTKKKLQNVVVIVIVIGAG